MMFVYTESYYPKQKQPYTPVNNAIHQVNNMGCETVLKMVGGWFLFETTVDMKNYSYTPFRCKKYGKQYFCTENQP